MLGLLNVINKTMVASIVQIASYLSQINLVFISRFRYVLLFFASLPLKCSWVCNTRWLDSIRVWIMNSTNVRMMIKGCVLCTTVVKLSGFFILLFFLLLLLLLPIALWWILVSSLWNFFNWNILLLVSVVLLFFYRFFFFLFFEFELVKISSQKYNVFLNVLLGNCV